MIKKIVFIVAKFLFKWAITIFWAHLDKDGNGSISKKELKGFIDELNYLKRKLSKN